MPPCQIIEGHTICALGDAAAWPVQGLIRHFRCGSAAAAVPRVRSPPFCRASRPRRSYPLIHYRALLVFLTSNTLCPGLPGRWWRSGSGSGGACAARTAFPKWRTSTASRTTGGLELLWLGTASRTTGVPCRTGLTPAHDCRSRGGCCGAGCSPRPRAGCRRACTRLRATHCCPSAHLLPPLSPASLCAAGRA